MFDTVAFYANFMCLPDVELMVRNDCIPFFNQHGEVWKIVLNDKQGAKEPRITITRSWSGGWRLQAEVSIGAWLFGSNLFLPDEKDIERFLSDLSDFVWYKTGLRFDIRRERITVLDVTQDFQLSESRVLSVLKDLSNVNISKYNRRPFNDTSVYWENKGEKKNKVIKVYSKEHDFIDKEASKEEKDLAKGVLRLEIHHGNTRSVSNLRKSLKLPDYTAGNIITPKTSKKVINDTMKLLNLESLLKIQSDSPLKTLAQNFDKSMPLTLAGHLAFKAKFGLNYPETLGINLSEETIKKYDRDCARTGTLSL